MLLTVSDIAKELNVSRSKIYEMVERGEIEHHRIGGAIRFTAENLNDLLRRSKQERKVSSPQSPVSRPNFRGIRL